jgi:hypothetical protein
MIIFFFGQIFYYSAQHGFFKGRSTATNLNCMKNGVAAIYTDFSKAFDKRLLKRLAKLGFGGSFLAWIGSYLTGHDQFVRASGFQSRRLSVRFGVPQSSHLGPLLFILFINDVFSCFKSLRILLYADCTLMLPATVTLQMCRLNWVFFPSSASTAECSSTWESIRA